MSTRATTPERFDRAVASALEIPTPREIARRIMASTDGAHNGLRAASYDAKVSGGVTSSHAEREAEQRIEHGTDARTALADLRALNRAGARVLDAVDAIAAECLDAGTVDDWEEALDVANRLNETIHGKTCTRPSTGCDCRNPLEDGLAVGYDLDAWVEQFHRSVAIVRGLYRKYYEARTPSRWTQIKESGLLADEICDTCAALDPPVYIAARNQEFQLCRHCNDLRLEHGHRPPTKVKQAHHHGSQTDYRRALSEWVRELQEDRYWTPTIGCA